MPFDTCTRTLLAVARHRDAKISTAACCDRHRTLGHIRRSVDLVAVDCEHLERRVGPGLYRSVVGIDHPDPYPLTRFGRDLKITGDAVERLHAGIRVGGCDHINGLALTSLRQHHERAKEAADHLLM